MCRQERMVKCQVMEHGDEVHGDGDGHLMMMIKLQLGKQEREKQKPSVDQGKGIK